MWYGHFVNFAAVWCIFTILVYCAKENLVTLVQNFELCPEASSVG
jgi:hypothetical protein